MGHSWQGKAGLSRVVKVNYGNLLERTLLNIGFFERLKKSVKERQRKENKKKIARARHFLRVTYPIFCIVFVVGFWVLGLYHFWVHGDGHDAAEVIRQDYIYL